MYERTVHAYLHDTVYLNRTVDMDKVRRIFDDTQENPFAFDAFTFALAHLDHQELIAEFLVRGALPDATALSRAICWDNAGAVRVLLDACDADAIAEAFRTVARDVAHVWGKCHLRIPKAEKTVRAMVFHPRIRTLPRADLKKVVRQMYWPVLDDLEEELSRGRTLERMGVIKEELIRTTWHPARHVAWCLDASFEL